MNSSRTFVLASALAAVVVLSVHLLDFPGSVPRFVKESNGGVLLDIAPAFGADAIYQRLAAYGPSGRASYIFRNLTVDVLLPLSMLPFLYLFMRKAVEALPVSLLSRPLLLSFAFLYVGFDLVENVMVLVLLQNYPARSELLALILPYVTLVKRAASMLALFLPGIILLWQWAAGRKTVAA